MILSERVLRPLAFFQAGRSARRQLGATLRKRGTSWRVLIYKQIERPLSVQAGNHLLTLRVMVLTQCWSPSPNPSDKRYSSGRGRISGL